MVMHPIMRRYIAEDLVRKRPAGEQRRYVASQRSGKIDPNPHQIDAVIFALGRIPEGGCILADEVGLGKTIEAGLVIAQLLAESAERILLITPKALLGQWRQELFDLFAIAATEYAPGVDLARPGVFLVTRDFAGGEAGVDILGNAPRFDLCVIDEAHEIFAGVYKRYDRAGDYDADSMKARMAGRVRELLRETPVLLLTATPIQNTLSELWGLAQFVEPTGTLLGNLATFRQMFCAGDDRHLAPGQEHELRRRLAEICQRTLRRQAQEFMKRPFVGRRTQLFEYAMSVEEQALYNDVTEYLLEPAICAFRGNQRRLLLIGFHRRMASSTPALASSLERICARLARLLDGTATLKERETANELLDDLEEDERDDDDRDDEPPPSPEAIQAELARVREFVRRARSLPSDAKALALVRAVNMVTERARVGDTSGKIVVFTESITTQNYLRGVLIESGAVQDEEVTLFRGSNEGPRVKQALERWLLEEEAQLAKSARPSRDIATRLALVHEFRTRGKVFISTEAGAKGLNLQFASTLVNYDLPWNPQRIEQRIGRVHRYGQTRDVLVINFAADGNAAQKLTLEILMQKLDLFGTVLGASDEVLHEPTTDAPETIAGAFAVEFESRIRRIYERARTQKEIESELIQLRETIADERARFEEIHKRTATLIESRFDDQVKRVFRRIQDELPVELAAFDTEVERVVHAYLDAITASYERTMGATGVRFAVAASSRLPVGLQEGFTAHVGDARDSPDAEHLHMGHSILRAAVDEARQATAGIFNVELRRVPDLQQGQRGRLRLVKVRYGGFEASEELFPVVVIEGDESPLDLETARQVLGAVARDVTELRVEIEDDAMDDAVREFLFTTERARAQREQERFSRTVEQIEMSVEDRVLLLQRQKADAETEVEEATDRRDKAVGADSRTKADRVLRRRQEKLQELEDEVARLQRREDDDYSRWIERANQRRSQTPTVEVLLDARFVLADP